MKTKLTLLISTITILLFVGKSYSQNIGINGTGGNAHPSALLDVDAVATPNLGILIPRIALQAINLAAPVTSPATSLLVYNTASASSGTNAVSAGYYYWDGIQWVRFAYNPSGVSAAAWNLIGNAGTAAGTNFLGTTDAQDLVFKTNALEAVRINTLGNVGINNTNPSTAKLAVNSSNSAHDVITALHTSGSTTAAFHAVRGSVANASYTTAVGYLAYHNTSNATYGLYGTGGNFGAVVLNKTYIGNLQPSSIINTGDLEVSNVIGGTNAANLTLRQSTSITTAASDMGYLNFSDNAIPGAQASIRVNREQASSGITDLPTALTFHTILDGTATLSEQMRISNNGFVGIGTSTPLEKLEIQGSVKIVDGTQGAGKVLTSDAFGKASWVESAVSTNKFSYSEAFPASVAVPTPGLLITLGSSFVIATKGIYRVLVDATLPAGMILGIDNQSVTNSAVYSTASNRYYSQYFIYMAAGTHNLILYNDANGALTPCGPYWNFSIEGPLN